MAPMMISQDPSEGSTSPNSLPPQLRDPEPIAICGLACRLPGDSTSPQRFWDLISQGRSAQCDVPESRFNVGGFYHPQGMDRPGSMTMKGGYFLKEDVREFENSFFGINNLEATHMDPQQRKLLEVVFQCLENAGVSLSDASGSNTGCYVGNFTVDFQVMQLRDSDYLHHYSGTGLGTTILANRISHVFNLLGPSLVLDTACSSSLYCLHVACTALENYECDAAIVAGANLIQSAEQHLATMKAGVLSPTSACHTFDTSADGYGRADGVGALYLKRLCDAIADGDPIRSVIRGSAVNANGRTSGISLPSADGQALVIRKAMAKAGLQPDEITYIECHGTGTKVGDAIEVEALDRVFARGAQDPPLLIGAVKSSVGHSEAASGISSIIKSIMALERGQIPPTHGLKNINPKLKIDERNITIPTELVDWPDASSRVRRVGINSFGYGGANSHVILEEAPRFLGQSLVVEEPRHFRSSQSSVVLPLSAASKPSLEARVADFANFDFGDTHLSDLAYTLGCRRTNFPVRGFLVSPRRGPISDLFRSQTLVTSTNTPSNGAKSPYAFVFTGQGSQWPGMCRELFDEFPVFYYAMTEMESTLKSLTYAPTWSLSEAILDMENPDLIHLPERSQSCCTAIQIALIQLLASWDISPTVVVGHSSGEIAAAFAAGYISAAEAITIAYYRGYLVSQPKQSQGGAMAAVGLSDSAANEEISNAGLEGQAKVACVNSPEGVTISGDVGAVDQLLQVLQEKNVFARKLKTGGQAYHSHHMLAIGDEYEALLDRVLPTLGPSVWVPQGATFVSSVIGAPKSSGFSGQYWRSNLESQVRFAPAIQYIQSQSDHCFIELGPHSSLELPIKQTLAKAGVSGSEVKYAAPLKRNTNALESSLRFAGSLWLQGREINWTKVNGLHTGFKSSKPLHRVLTDLPPYRFNYENSLWKECRASVEYRNRKNPRHELLGSLIPGGNGRDFIFRNLLREGDVSWLKDHKLGNTTVFPGSAYLAMAMEAVTQATGIDRANKPSFCFSNVNITNALALSTEPPAQIEVFTSLHRAALTNTADSTTWWDFNISSFSTDTSVSHATGSIAVKDNTTILTSRYRASEDSLEPAAKRTWYEKFTHQGLNYGPTFQTIDQFETPRMKSGLICGAKAPLLTVSGDPLTEYPVHPITLDAMMQLAVVSAANGTPKDLRALVPTRLVSATIATAMVPSDAKCQIYSRVQSTGFGPIEAGIELTQANGEVVAQFDQVRLTPYSATTWQSSEAGRRHPVLRVLWKPDVHGLGLMSSQAAGMFVQRFADEADSPVDDKSLIKFGGMIDLLVHKNPRARILELGNEYPELTTAILDLLSSGTDFKRFSTYYTATFSKDGSLMGNLVDLETGQRSEKATNIEKGEFDLVLIPAATPRVQQNMSQITELLADGGSICAICLDSENNFTTASGMSCLSYPLEHGSATLIVARHTPRSNFEALRKRKFLIVERNKSKLGSALADALSKIQGYWVMRTTLRNLIDAHVPQGVTIFNLCELTSPLLSTISDEDMQHVKKMTDRAASLVWVTGGNILQGDDPNFALASGLARAVGMEQPSLKFYTYDIDNAEADVDATANHLISVLNQQGSIKPDMEFAQHKGVIHISRFVPDDRVNAVFRNKQGLEPLTLTLADSKDIRLTIERPSQFDTIFFKQQETPQSIPPSHIRIKVASVGMNAKDYYVLAGRVDTPYGTCQLECAGTVEQVGSAVTGFSVGDRVVAMAPSHFQTYQTLPEWACHKLLETENFDVCATLPLVYSTAIYALHYRARIQAKETILIHSGAGGVGIAAIQLALAAGAEVFTTVSTEEKKKYLIETFGIKPSNIFSSRDTSFLEGVLRATSGRGVDVILNSLTGDQLHATWRCAADFGRFVEIGKLDLSTAGRLEMDQFLKNTTFTAFDLGNLYFTDNEQHHALWSQLLSQVMTLFRERKIAAFEHLRVFDISEITQAYRHFASRSRIGKIAINLENPKSEVSVQQLKHVTRFRGDKSYVMVGCLGGLGRTLSRWMISRGARKFAFLGRSGLRKAAAQNLVQDLKALGAECSVITGDVCEAADVRAVVDAAAGMGDIGGVVQAAMGLNEAIFADMPNHYWHTGIDPKVQGTWNLYEALRSGGGLQQLDFFLLTSSVSGSVGTATESNYCAGNHFLDLFARHLRGKGLPAVSVGLGMISEVGYLHDNPEIEALLLRKGIQPIDADELLQIIDLALSSASEARTGIHHAYDDLAAAHLLTGLEAAGLQELRRKGFDGNHPVLEDARAGLLASALGGDAAHHSAHGQEGNLPTEVVKAIEEEGRTLAQAVLDHVRRRFANLVLMKYEAVDVKKPLAEYGMDSMIGAEFRTWLYQSLTVDVPLSMLLGKTCTLEALGDTATAALGKENGESD